MSAMAQQRSLVAPRDPAGLREWLLACGIALALHAVVATMLLWHGDRAAGEENYGVTALEIGLENAAPSFDGAEAAESTDASAAAVASEQVVPAREETAPVSKMQAAEPEQRAEPPPKVEATHETQDVVAAAATTASQSAAAPSRAAERESTQSIATSIGSSASAQRAKLAWQRGMLAHIERQKREMANATGSADIVVRFAIDHRGRLIALDIAKGSGDARYDQAALDIVRRADPMPPPPAGLPDQNLVFRIPISFRAGG